MRYFDGALSKGFYKFITARSFMFVAEAFSGLFVPIFLFQLFSRDIHLVLIFYIELTLLYILLLPFSRNLNRIGFKTSLVVSIFALIAYYLLFYFTDQANMVAFIPLALIALVTFRLMYWLPYHADFALLTDRTNRGRQFSFLMFLYFTISIVAPLTAAVIVDMAGFDTLFMVAIATLVVTSFFFSKIDRIEEQYTWSPSKTWNMLGAHMKDKKLLAYVAEGIESFAGLYMWPIFIFMILNGDVIDVGITTTFITLATIVLQLLTGNMLDRAHRAGAFLKWGGIFYSIGWTIKVFVTTAFEIFIAGVYHSFTSIFAKTPFHVSMYDIAADQGHYVDEYTVLCEMAINIGRFIMGVAIFGMLYFVGLKWAFLLAALASLVLNLITQSRVDLRKEAV